MLLIEVGVLWRYSGAMCLLGLLSPVFKEPTLLITWVGLLIAAALSLLSFTGVVLCVFGIVSRKSFFKWLLISLSVLGVIPLPVAISYRVDVSGGLVILYAFACWGALLFTTTLIAFPYIKATPLRQQLPDELREDTQRRVVRPAFLFPHRKEADCPAPLGVLLGCRGYPVQDLSILRESSCLLGQSNGRTTEDYNWGRFAALEVWRGPK